MAVWCPTKQGNVNASVELHFNLWRLPRLSWWRKIRTWRWGAQPDFVEIGVLIDDRDQIESVGIFLPFRVKKLDVEDCGPSFRDKDIAEGIFNEKISIEIPATESGAFVDLKVDGKAFCRVHEFEKSDSSISENQLALTDVDHGTILEISRHAIAAATSDTQQEKRIYFRLRILIPKVRNNPFIQPIHPSDWALQSGFEEVELINFRLNEMRTLPDKVQNRLRQSGNAVNARVRLVAFLTAIPAISDMTSSSSPPHKIRTLEREIWDTYVDNGLPDDVAVYHWRKSAKSEHDDAQVDEFSTFVKLKQRRAGLGTIAIYLLIAFAFGVSGNLAAGWLDTKFSLFSSPIKQAPEVELPTSEVEPGEEEQNK